MIKYAAQTAKNAKGRLKAKEALLVLVILAMGGAALAWGASQAAPARKAELSPDEQCRTLVNGILGGDSQILLRYLRESDKRSLQMTEVEMSLLHEKMISPRFGFPFAWRAREGKVLSCGSQSGMIALVLGHHAGPERLFLRLNVQNDKGKVSYRYHDLMMMTASLDRAAKLKGKQLDDRIADDARTLIRTDLPGFDLLHPSSHARSIYSKEKDLQARRLGIQNQRNLLEAAPTPTLDAPVPPGPGESRRVFPMVVEADELN